MTTDGDGAAERNPETGERQNILDLQLPCQPKAPYMARQALRKEERLLGPRLELLELLVTETITNAVLHSGGDADSTVRLVLSLEGGRARAVIEDRGPGFKPQLPEKDVWSTSRRGLLFLDELADRWGTSNEDAHAVWFEVDLTA